MLVLLKIFLSHVLELTSIINKRAVSNELFIKKSLQIKLNIILQFLSKWRKMSGFIKHLPLIFFGDWMLWFCLLCCWKHIYPFRSIGRCLYSRYHYSLGASYSFLPSKRTNIYFCFFSMVISRNPPTRWTSSNSLPLWTQAISACLRVVDCRCSCEQHVPAPLPTPTCAVRHCWSWLATCSTRH